MDGEIMISKRWFRVRMVLFLIVFIIPSFVLAQQYSLGAKGKEAVGTKVMVATAHPLATQAGIEMFQTLVEVVSLGDHLHLLDNGYTNFDCLS